MKQILAALLTFSIILAPISVNAEDEIENTFRTQEELIHIAQYHISDYDTISIADQNSVYYLGTAIPVYHIEGNTNNKNVKKLSDVRFYPVYKNNQVIFTI